MVVGTASRITVFWDVNRSRQMERKPHQAQPRIVLSMPPLHQLEAKHVIRRCLFLMATPIVIHISARSTVFRSTTEDCSHSMQTVCKPRGQRRNINQQAELRTASDNQKTHSLVSADWSLVESSILHSSLLHRTTSLFSSTRMTYMTVADCYLWE